MQAHILERTLLAQLLHLTYDINEAGSIAFDDDHFLEARGLAGLVQQV
jgi:hypothetical protein